MGNAFFKNDSLNIQKKVLEKLPFFFKDLSYCAFSFHRSSMKFYLGNVAIF